MENDPAKVTSPTHAPKLTELPATAICGNDITSSGLNVSALAIIYVGQYAWIALLMVAAVLYLFRNIYGEVVGALPLNGGAYNALLKLRRHRLLRPVRASWLAILLAMTAVAGVLAGNAYLRVGVSAIFYPHHLPGFYYALPHGLAGIPGLPGRANRKASC